MCAAHFAVIMFGIVALVGPAHGAGAMFLAVGLVAVMCLAVHGALRVGVCVCLWACGTYETWVVLCTAHFGGVLEYLCRASRLSGAPPAFRRFNAHRCCVGGESKTAFASLLFSGGAECP